MGKVEGGEGAEIVSLNLGFGTWSLESGTFPTTLPKLPRRHWLCTSPQSYFRVPRYILQDLQCIILWAVFSVPPGISGLDELPVQALSIREDHFSDSPAVAVVAFYYYSDDFPEGQVGCEPFGLLSVGLFLLRAVDAVQADALGFAVVQDIDRISIHNTDNSAGEISGEGGQGQPCGQEDDEDYDR